MQYHTVHSNTFAVPFLVSTIHFLVKNWQKIHKITNNSIKNRGETLILTYIWEGYTKETSTQNLKQSVLQFKSRKQECDIT